MFLYDMARKVNKYRKLRKKTLAGRHLSPVRRIERTAALRDGRFVAMTFDDGPDALPPNPPVKGSGQETGLTEELLRILDKYGAKGTFDVIGTTENNYPDVIGKKDSFTCGGIKYDHYPEFGKDSLGGVKNQPGLARRIAAGGHELTNHGCTHRIFGPMRVVYGTREYFKSLNEVVADLSSLHELVIKETGFAMRLSRPPHYIDSIPGGYSSYDAYQCMDYNYLAASFDGGGYKPTTGDYARDVRDMIAPLEALLMKDPEALNGQIIFQKDGSNMSRQTPVADALEPQLKLLAEAGYKVVTVSELLSMSPFEDLGDTDPSFEWARRLAGAGYTVGYRNNTFQPDRLVTKRELAIMSTPPGVFSRLMRELTGAGGPANPAAGDRPASSVNYGGIPLPYYINTGIIQKFGGLFPGAEAYAGLYGPDAYGSSDAHVTAADFEKYLERAAAGKDIKWDQTETKNEGTPPPQPGLLRRRDVIRALALLYTPPSGL